jgi:hypothetical protein
LSLINLPVIGSISFLVLLFVVVDDDDDDGCSGILMYFQSSKGCCNFHKGRGMFIACMC